MSRDEKLERKVYALPGGQEFKEEVDRLNVQQLEARISNYQKELDKSETHKEQNESLKAVKAEKAELEGPYNDVKKSIKVKTKYIIELIKEKGGNA